MLERKGLEIRVRVWVKLIDFNANSDDDVVNAFIFFSFLFHFIMFSIDINP